MLTTNLRDPNKNVSRLIRFTKLSAVFRLNTPTTFTGTLDPSSTPFFDRIAPGWGVRVFSLAATLRRFTVGTIRAFPPGS